MEFSKMVRVAAVTLLVPGLASDKCLMDVAPTSEINSDPSIMDASLDGLNGSMHFLKAAINKLSNNFSCSDAASRSGNLVFGESNNANDKKAEAVLPASTIGSNTSSVARPMSCGDKHLAVSLPFRLAKGQLKHSRCENATSWTSNSSSGCGSSLSLGTSNGSVGGSKCHRISSCSSSTSLIGSCSSGASPGQKEQPFWEVYFKMPSNDKNRLPWFKQTLKDQFWELGAQLDAGELAGLFIRRGRLREAALVLQQAADPSRVHFKASYKVKSSRGQLFTVELDSMLHLLIPRINLIRGSRGTCHPQAREMLEGAFKLLALVHPSELGVHWYSLPNGESIRINHSEVILQDMDQRSGANAAIDTFYGGVRKMLFDAGRTRPSDESDCPNRKTTTHLRLIRSAPSLTKFDPHSCRA